MIWKDRLVPASFRDVPFFVDSHEYRSGRDAVVHSYPQRDKAYVEDVGRKARRYRIRGYLLGEDYLETRDALIEAVETRPLGWPFDASQILVHPYFGKLRVLCEDFTLTETRTEGRFASFVATFVETAEVEAPAEVVNAAAVADETAGDLEDASGAPVEDDLVTEGPGILDQVRDASRAAIAAVGNALNSLPNLNGALAEIEAFQSNVTGVINQASVLATSPAQLVNDFKAAVGGILRAADNFTDSLFAYEELLGFDAADLKSGGDSNTSRFADRNVDLISQLTLELAAAGAIRSIARIEFESFDEAEERRTKLAATLDGLLLSASYCSYDALLEAQTKLVQLVPADAVKLPRLLDLRLQVTEPSLVVAHRIYGDANRAAEITARNKIRRPGFVPGGVDLLVLSV